MQQAPVRIIARLDVKGPNLVKGLCLEGLRVLGSPDDFAEYYYQQGIDELFYMDVVASLYGRNSLIDMISRIAKRVFIPLTVGGGIRTIDDINRVLRAGADKVCINTAAIKNSEFVKQAVKKFGSSTIVVAIEAIRQKEGSYYAYVDNGREFTGVEVLSWAQQLDEMKIGELVITSVDREGTGTGFDLELVRNVGANVNIPVIAHGGAGSMKDVVDLFLKSDVKTVALASILHYHYVEYNRDAFKASVLNEGNLSFLKSKQSPSKINSCHLGNLKQELLANGILCRS